MFKKALIKLKSMAKSELAILEKKFIVSKLGIDSEIDSSIIELIREAMGMDRTLDWVSARTDSNHRDTIFCAYIINGIVGCVNFFTPFEFFMENKTILAHQSGFSASRVQFKGRGLWPSLMIESEAHLASINSKFIFGFPNAVSTPIFAVKLNYTKTFFNIDLFNLTFMKINKVLGKLFSKDKEIKGYYSCNYDDLKLWQMRQNGEEQIYENSLGNSRLWGKLRAKKISIFTLRFLEIGGYETNSSIELQKLVINCMKENNLNYAVQLSSLDNELTNLRQYKLKYNQPFIFKPLSDDTDLLSNISFCGGNRDVF